MERKKYILTVLFIVLAVNIFASDKEIIYKAYVSDDMALWKSVIDKIDNQKVKTYEVRLELLNYQYGYVGWCIGQKKYDLAEKYIDIAESNIDYLEKNKYQLSTVYAYKAAFTGFEIALSSYKAVFLGPKSIDYANKAVELNPYNYQAYIQLGNIEFYMPAVFGGSKAKAIDYYLMAERIMVKNKTLIHKNWNYLSLLHVIMNAYIETKDYPKAKEYYYLILKIEPDLLWIKKEVNLKIFKH